MFQNSATGTLRPLHLTLLVALAWGLVACGQSQPAADVAAHSAVAAPKDDKEVVIAPAMAAHFQVARLALNDLTTTQEVAGRIEANERHVTRIGASVTGRVTTVLAEVGDRVKLGQALAQVASPELTQAQLAYLRARASSELAERAVERARQLIQADVIGSAELQRRESELSIARAERRAAEDQLRLMGLPGEAILRLRDSGSLHPHANVLATQAGVVIERKISQGQVAQPGDPLFTVADLGTVWVVGELPEQAARTVQTGQKVDIDVPALGQKLSGKIVFVGDTVSPETRTVPVRTQVDNVQRSLKPQMLATMRLAGPVQRVLAVPSVAVVRENDQDHLYVQTAAGRYRLTPVELGPASEGMRPVLKGLSEGAPIVVQGAFHLNNERKRAELE